MKYSFLSRIRDILLLCALFCLVKTAADRTSSFLAEHKESMVHELDRTFIDQIYTAQRQLHFLEEHPVYAHTYAHAIGEIKEQLTIIEEKYKKNSPSLALLGPIGSAAIVVKEAQLEQKLLEAVNELSKIFANIEHPYSAEASKDKQEFKPSQTINCALDTNKKSLHMLVA
ncbi:MAG TPA: hypothetical protein VHX42_04620 [Candidatus Babeliales bacterium]|jgi:hypothetical protein|nr:hypothetical protein [Candidatus Babeliales bacterium]